MGGEGGDWSGGGGGGGGDWNEGIGVRGWSGGDWSEVGGLNSLGQPLKVAYHCVCVGGGRGG